MEEKQKTEATQPTVIIQQQSSNPFQMGGNSIGNGIDVRDILFMCLSRWWWFVLSFLLCGLWAWYQIRTTPQIFSRTAKLMIKSDSKQSLGGVMDGLSEVGINKNNSNINNELIALKSPSIYTELVRQLGLNTTYSRTGKMLDKDMYGSSLPIKVEFLDLAERDYARLTLTMDGKGGLIMSNQNFGGKTQDEPIPISYNDTIPTIMGRLIVRQAPSYWNGQLFEINVNHVSLNDMANTCAANLSAYVPDESSSIINITYYDTSVQRAEDIINVVINLYNQNWVKDRNQVAVATSKFITERLDKIEEELCEVEDQIYDYKSDNLLPESGTSSGVYLSQSMQSDLQVEELNMQLYMCRYVRNYVSNPENTYVLLPANTGLGIGAAEAQIAQYNNLLMNRNEILSQSSLKNPVVLEYDKKLEEQREVILASLDNQMKVIDSQLSMTRNRYYQSNRKLASAHDQSKFLQRIQRQQKVKEQLYTYLLQKREETELNQAFIAYNSRLISPPSGSFAPVSPDVNKIKTTAAIVGAAIPFALILLLYLMNTKVRGRKDVDKLSVPFVGELPQVERTKAERKGAANRTLDVKLDSKNMINEAFRIIRSNLAFMVGPKSKEQSKVIMVTSINAGSGKTFIMANLAASFAISGKKVLILDLDLRKRSISKFVGRPKSGMSTYLSGLSGDWHNSVVPITGYDNLFMMPAGTTSPNPSELLADARMQQMIDEAKLEYDYIFLDCPPAEIVADATIIKPLAEVTLFVVRVGVMERSHLPVIEQYYKEKTFNNLCLILNGSEAIHSRYGYYRYGYGYSYGYGYGYGYGYNYGYGYYGEKESKRDSNDKD